MFHIRYAESDSSKCMSERGVSRRPATAHGRPAAWAGEALPEVKGRKLSMWQFSNERNEDLQFARAR